jgi:hypothetical protein
MTFPDRRNAATLNVSDRGRRGKSARRFGFCGRGGWFIRTAPFGSSFVGPGLSCGNSHSVCDPLLVQAILLVRLHAPAQSPALRFSTHEIVNIGDLRVPD